MEHERETPRILSQQSARTLTNVADALGVDDPIRLAALAEAAEAWLQRRGVGTARRAWLQLAWIEWRPALLRGRARAFSRLPCSERATRLEGRPLRVVRAMIGASASDPARPGEAQSSPGA